MPTARHIFVAILLALAAAPAAAQTITGLVREAGTQAPLLGVQVLLVDDQEGPRAQAFTDERGAFMIRAPAAGSYRISAFLIGYATVASEAMDIAPHEEVTLEIRMAVEAVPLEPVVVRHRNVMDSDLAGFYTRMERGRKSGFGHFISREDVERTSPLDATDLLRTAPGVRVVRGRGGYGAGLRMSGGCVPAIFVDGSHVNRYPMHGVSLDEVVSAFSIEGVEVYRGAAAQIGRFHDPSGCGVILVWTRRGTYSDEPFSWKKLLAGLAAIGVLILIAR